MQYELRSQVIEPKRQTYQNIIDRLGDQPASRYLEATLDVEPRENFHYRPTWAQDRELYDERYSALRLGDPYRFLDPRQLYYTPYVTNRAALHEAFGKTLGYLEERDLLATLPDAWGVVLTDVVVPLRHYESGAQLVTVAGARFATGTSIEQCCTFAAFDRMGNAQMLSRVGIAMGAGTADVLARAKEAWLDDDHLQPLRRLVEEVMVVDDWAEGLLVVDMVDSLVYPLLYRGLDEEALLSGAGAFSLFAQHPNGWFADQRRWIDALVGTWLDDEDHGEQNRTELARIAGTWRARVDDAVRSLTRRIDAVLPGADTAAELDALVAAREGSWAQPIEGRTIEGDVR